MASRRAAIFHQRCAAGVRLGVVVVLIILLKIFVGWVVVSVVGGLSFAPALSRRLRDVNELRDPDDE